MVRKFTKDVGRFRKDDVRDYPKSTWDDIAASVNRPLSRFSDPVDTFNNADRKDRR